MPWAATEYRRFFVDFYIHSEPFFMSFIPGPLEGRIKKLQARESAAGAANASGEPSKRRRLLPATGTSTPKREKAPLSFSVTPKGRPAAQGKDGKAGKKKRPPAAVDNAVRAFAPPPSLAKALLPFQKKGVEFALNQVRTSFPVLAQLPHCLFCAHHPVWPACAHARMLSSNVSVLGAHRGYVGPALTEPKPTAHSHLRLHHTQRCFLRAT